MEEQRSSWRPYIIASLIALLIAGSAALYKFAYEEAPRTPHVIPVLGKAGSFHGHASLLLFIGNKPMNFCESRFMLRSPFVHFEDNNCQVVHSHATGVTLPVFFKTIGVELTSACIALPFNNERHCNNGKDRLRVVINTKEVSIDELPYYELQNNDHILVNFGPETGAFLRFKYNGVPNVPMDINEPLVQG
jgi:hypothetical protein